MSNSLKRARRVIAPRDLLGVPLKFGGCRAPHSVWDFARMNSTGRVSGVKQMFYVEHVMFPFGFSDKSTTVTEDFFSVAFRVAGANHHGPNHEARLVHLDGGITEEVGYYRVEGYDAVMYQPNNPKDIKLPKHPLNGMKVFLDMSVKKPSQTLMDRITFVEPKVRLWSNASLLWDKYFNGCVYNMLHLAKHRGQRRDASYRTVGKDKLISSISSINSEMKQQHGSSVSQYLNIMRLLIFCWPFKGEENFMVVNSPRNISNIYHNLDGKFPESAKQWLDDKTHKEWYGKIDT